MARTLSMSCTLEALRQSIAEHPDWCGIEHTRSLGRHAVYICTLARQYHLTMGGKRPLRPLTVERLRQSIAEHPDWLAIDHARALGLSQTRIHYFVAKYRLVLPRWKRASTVRRTF